MKEKKIGTCKAPKESEIKYILRWYRKAAEKPEKYGNFCVRESERLNAYDLLTAEYENILNGKSTLSAIERKQVSDLINILIDVKNEKTETEQQ